MSDRIARDRMATDTLGNAGPVVAGRVMLKSAARCARSAVTHSHPALAFHVGGSARVEQDGDWKLAAGDVLLVPAGQAHRMLDVQSTEFWGLAFCAPCFAATGDAALLEPFDRVRDGGAAVVHIPAARQSVMEALFRELEAAALRPQRSAAALFAVQRSLLTLILHEVDSATVALAPQTAKRTPHVVADCLRFIERNALRRLTLRDVAQAVGRSPAYVTSVLSKSTGRSAVEWIVCARMAEARRLLLHSDERVDEIAERVGYPDPTHFIRMFRRSHGVTPAAFRATRSH